MRPNHELTLVLTRLEARVRNDFSVAAANDALRSLGALNFEGIEPQGRERIQAAIVLLAGGDPAKFDHYVSLANADWRDVLVSSGLGDEDGPSGWTRSSVCASVCQNRRQ